MRAVRFSMGIPLLFTFEKYKDHLMVDGSILAEDALYHEWSDDDTPVVYFRLRSTASQRGQGIVAVSAARLPDDVDPHLHDQHLARVHQHNLLAQHRRHRDRRYFATGVLVVAGTGTACSAPRDSAHVLPLKLGHEGPQLASGYQG